MYIQNKKHAVHYLHELVFEQEEEMSQVSKTLTDALITKTKTRLKKIGIN